jgi:hypothetical protein
MWATQKATQRKQSPNRRKSGHPEDKEAFAAAEAAALATYKT